MWKLKRKGVLDHSVEGAFELRRVAFIVLSIEVPLCHNVPVNRLTAAALVAVRRSAARWRRRFRLFARMAGEDAD